MRKIVRYGNIFTVVAALAACSGQEPQEQETTPAVVAAGSPAAESVASAAAEASATPATAAVSPPPAFAQCRSCHSPEPGKNGVGPSLAGIFGQKAAEVAGYNFSPAMKSSGLTWDEATLDRYIKSPRTVVPDTKMTYPGIQDDAKRAAVIAYLKAIQ